MPFITVHHPDRPDSTHKMDEHSFNKVWKAMGWKTGEYKKPSKSKKTDSEDTTPEEPAEEPADADT